MSRKFTFEDVAKICHETNRMYCRTISDYTQESWADAPDWQRESSIKGVKFVVENPDAGPSASHDSWLKEKKETGWKYGPVKNPELKEHPCFVSYDELPAEQKIKDKLFIAVVKSFEGFIDG